MRPIVTVFGLIGGMACFGAMTVALNNLFDLVVQNSTGSSTTLGTAAQIDLMRRGTIDHFFFTVMYAILVYLMATASFKMIDTIPKAFMRWMNTGISTFNDSKGDPTQDLTTYAAFGGARASQQVFSGLQRGMEGISSLPTALKTMADGKQQ